MTTASALFFTAVSGFSQGKVQIDREGLLKRIEKSDAEIANPKKAEKAATWLNRGKLFYDAATEVSKNLFDGMDIAMLEAMFGEPSAVEEVDLGGVPMRKMSYPYFTAYVNADNQLKAWKTAGEIYEGALEKSVEAYQKAYELDKSVADKVRAGTENIFNLLLKEGGSAYVIQDFQGAGDSFARAYGVSVMPGYNLPDSSAAYNAGLAYLFSEDYPHSLENFDIAENLQYEQKGELYYLKYHAYKGLAEQDSTVLSNAKATLEKGIKRFPDNADIIESLTDYYVSQGEDPASIVPLVQEAIAKDPDNPALWNGLGRIYEQLGDNESSVKAFEKVAELMPGNPNAFFSVGVLYLRIGDKMGEELNKKTFTGQAEYDAELSEVFDVYKKALAPLEKAHELNPTEKLTVELLKNVTFRLRDQEGMMEKYDKYNELLKNMQ